MKGINTVFPRLLFMVVVSVLCLTGCQPNPYIETITKTTPREDYQAFLKSEIVSSDTFNLKTLSSALIVKALVYSPEVNARARTLFPGDPIFIKETASWNRTPKGAYGPPMVVLMGLFTSDLGEKDVTKNGRFRPRLKTPDGHILTPVEIKRYGRDSTFVRDYFPAFDPWEEVFMVKFNPLVSSGFYSGRLEFLLEWPGGVQTLVLNETPDI